MSHFFELLKTRNEVLYYLGLACLVASLLCVVLIRVTNTDVMGINAWYKPLKFFLSTTIFVWSMAWYTGYLGTSGAVVWYSWGMVALFAFEDGYVAFQAARGQLSHFNVSTPLYAGLYSLMAVGAIGISLWTAYIGLLFFLRDFPGLPLAYVWGIRLGLVIFVLFSMQGMAMGARLTHTIGGENGSQGLPLVNWSQTYGDLRIAHFLGMHALQVIPLLAYYVVQNVKAVVVISVLYGLLTTAIFIQALQGKPLFGQRTQPTINEDRIG